MDILADTNILVRRINRYDKQHRETRAALKSAAENGHRICIVPQNVIECWNVCTRPVERNGLGLSAAHAERITARIEDLFPLLPERPEIFSEWKRLVARYAVMGLKVYDARLVASAVVHGIEALLTFNAGDFRRYMEVKVLHPSVLLGGTNPGTSSM